MNSVETQKAKSGPFSTGPLSVDLDQTKRMNGFCVVIGYVYADHG